jgi:hypothetical protein
MNSEFIALGLPIGKYIVASALMVVFYWFLFREKTSFNNCRVYLLSIALVGMLISQFNIVVYTPPAQIVEIEAQPVVLSTSPRSIAPTEPIQTSFTPTKATQNSSYAELLTVPNIALGIYIAVTCILFISLLIQLIRILALKRGGKMTTKDGFELVENDEIPTPFSFYKTIFLSPNLTGSKLDMILKHEQWHIKHHHYIDVFMMEVLVRLLWFNPVLWWIRNELRNVSEFHADRSVLDEGQELYSYQSIILEEVMENNPYLANGFNNSFTKKRFIMMKNKFNLRYTTLRRALILPFFVGIFSLLCFTTGKSETKYIESSKNLNSSAENKLTIHQNLDQDSAQTSMKGFSTKKLLEYYPKRLDLAIDKLNKIKKVTITSIKGDELNYIFKILDIVVTRKDGVKLNPFSEDLLSSITNEEIKATTSNFLKIKDSILKLNKMQSPLDQELDLKEEIAKITQDGLISKCIQDLSSQLPKAYSVKMADQNKNVEIAFSEVTNYLFDFQIVLETTENGIKFSSQHGCVWKELSYISNDEQIIDQNGIRGSSNLSDSKDSKFLISVKKSENGLILKGLKGTAWLGLTYNCTSNNCSQAIDQNGMSELTDKNHKTTTIAGVTDTNDEYLIDKMPYASIERKLEQRISYKVGNKIYSTKPMSQNVKFDELKTNVYVMYEVITAVDAKGARCPKSRLGKREFFTNPTYPSYPVQKD